MYRNWWRSLRPINERALGGEAEVRHALTIIREGTGADRQADLYRLRCLEGTR